MKYSEFEFICMTPRIFQRLRQSLFRCTTSCIESQGGCFEHFNNLLDAVTWRPDGHVHETFFFLVLWCRFNFCKFDCAFFDHPVYRVFQNLCHKLFLGIPHPKISKKVPINVSPKMNRFRDIDLRSCAGTLLSIT